MANGAAARIPFQKNKREEAFLLFVLFMRTYDNSMLGLQISCSSLVIPYKQGLCIDHGTQMQWLRRVIAELTNKQNMFTTGA